MPRRRQAFCGNLPLGYFAGTTLHGFAMFSAYSDEQPDAAEDINTWLAAGKLTPRIERVKPLAEAAAAHRLPEDNTIGRSGALSGKFVLKPWPVGLRPRPESRRAPDLNRR
jgi:NADPH:quinone reductase-like Zn-dependent oxidoreductase